MQVVVVDAGQQLVALHLRVVADVLDGLLEHVLAKAKGQGRLAGRQHLAGHAALGHAGDAELAGQALQQAGSPHVDGRTLAEADQVATEVQRLGRGATDADVGIGVAHHAPEVEHGPHGVLAVEAVELAGFLLRQQRVGQLAKLGHAGIPLGVFGRLLDRLLAHAGFDLAAEPGSEFSLGGVQLLRPLHPLGHQFVEVAAACPAQQVDRVFPVAAHRGVGAGRAQQISEQITQAAELLAQAGTHLAIPAGLPDDVGRVLVASLGTLVDRQHLIADALGDRAGALVPFLAALLQGLAVGVLVETVWDRLVLEFVAAVVVDCHARELERCPAILGRVSQLVLAHLALDLGAGHLGLFGRLVDRGTLGVSEAGSLASGAGLALDQQLMLGNVAALEFALAQQILGIAPGAVVELGLHRGRVKDHDLAGVWRGLVDHAIVALGDQVSRELVGSSAAAGTHAGLVFGRGHVGVLEPGIQRHDVGRCLACALLLAGVEVGHVGAVSQVDPGAQPACVLAVRVVHIELGHIVGRAVIQHLGLALLIAEHRVTVERSKRRAVSDDRVVLVEQLDFWRWHLAGHRVGHQVEKLFGGHVHLRRLGDVDVAHISREVARGRGAVHARAFDLVKHALLDSAGRLGKHVVGLLFLDGLIHCGLKLFGLALNELAGLAAGHCLALDAQVVDDGGAHVGGRDVGHVFGDRDLHLAIGGQGTFDLGCHHGRQLGQFVGHARLAQHVGADVDVLHRAVFGGLVNEFLERVDVAGAGLVGRRQLVQFLDHLGDLLDAHGLIHRAAIVAGDLDGRGRQFGDGLHQDVARLELAGHSLGRCFTSSTAASLQAHLAGHTASHAAHGRLGTGQQLAGQSCGQCIEQAHGHAALDGLLAGIGHQLFIGQHLVDRQRVFHVCAGFLHHLVDGRAVFHQGAASKGRRAAANGLLGQERNDGRRAFRADHRRRSSDRQDRRKRTSRLQGDLANCLRIATDRIECFAKRLGIADF